MLKRSLSLGLLILGLVSFTSCSKSLEVGSEFFPQIEGGQPLPLPQTDEGCGVGYNPITLDSSGTLADLASVEKSGALTYVGTEFYFEIASNGAVNTRVHANENAGSRPDWICGHNEGGAYPAGTNLIVSMALPTGSASGVTSMERFQAEAENTGLGMTAGTLGSVQKTIADVLGEMKDSEYRLYSMGGGAYELRIASTETLESVYAVKKSAIVRLQLAVTAAN